MKTVILDTNVLLADPNALLAFPSTDVVIPETVLGELDKLKTSRVDPELRFRGREVSRMLFELSEQGSLIDGVELPDGGTLRVVPLDTDAEIPDGLATRNADDRILAVAHQVCASGCPDGVKLVTNDLNMLLKAQTFGLEVQRHSDGPDGGFTKRFIIRPFQRYRVPLGILFTSFAIFAAIVFVTLWGPGARTPTAGMVPAEFRDQLPQAQQRILDYLVALEQNDADLDSRLSLANIYFDFLMNSGDVRYATLAIRHYERYLEVRPEATDVRVNMAVALFRLGGQTDRAISEARRVLEQEPNHALANYYLGLFYWRGQQDLQLAASQFSRVIELTQTGDDRVQAINREAVTALEQVRQQAEEEGQPLPEGGAF